MKFIFLTILLAIPSISQSQHDSVDIRQRILESKESDQMLIQRTRDFIFDKLESGSLNEASQAYNYAVEKLESEATMSFWIPEKLLLGFWFGGYELLYSADSVESSMDHDWRERPRQSAYLYPQRDRLSVELRLLTKKHRSALLHRIDSLVDDREKHDYLVLLFDWMTFHAVKPELTEEKTQEYLERDLTPRAEEFLETYKDSRFRPFVLRHFRYVYVLNDWGFGYSLGFGSLVPQGVFERYFKPEFTLGLGGDLSWKRVLVNAGCDVGIPVSIKQPFVYKGKTWSTNIRYNYITPYAAFGWIVEESSILKVIPHVGIGVVDASVTEDDKDRPGGDVSMTQGAMQYGLVCDIKFGLGDSFPKENNHSYYGIRMALDYLQFLGNNTIMSGGMLRLTVSWIAFSRAIFRDM